MIYNNEMEDLDYSWITEFEKQDNIYKNYYKEDITSVKLNCIYINHQNSIEKINEEIYYLNKANYVSREDIISIIKHKNIYNNINYNLLSILKYNIDLEPVYLNTYLKNKNPVSYNFLTSIKNIDSISFQPTISLFHDLNNLFILFYQKPYNPHTITKKIFIKNKQPSLKIKNKTLRNTFKDINK